MSSAGELKRTLVRRAIRTPVRALGRRAWHMAVSGVRARVERARDTRRRTYAHRAPVESVTRTIPRLETWIEGSAPAGFDDRVEAALAHRFDLLGSGPVRVTHDLDPRGLEGFRYEVEPPRPDPEGQWLVHRVTTDNLDESRRIWQWIDTGYTPVDWHRDFKSGYRWDETTWHGDVRVAPRPGVDIKVPWELARLQHLPVLALAHAREGGPERSRHAAEYRNQVLDFLATNPPGFGVNWRCPMDVAIRVANVLLAHDLFRAHGTVFEARFEALVARAAYEHGRHVRDHLEGVPGERANHYLADLAGLLFAGAFLRETRVGRRWLDFAQRELADQVDRQFGADGANFEASTCYHRLSSEMVLYSTAVLVAVRGVPVERVFSEGHVERLERMAEFVLHLTAPDGRVPQIGDNDSGRFFKLEAPVDHGGREDALDHRHLVAAVNGLLDRSDLEEFAGRTVETEIVRRLVGPAAGSYRDRDPDALPERVVVNGGVRSVPAAEPSSTAVFAVEGGRARTNLRTYGYPDFGVYVLRSDRIHLVVRCGSIGQDGNGGHAHLDQLSIVLAIDGETRVFDPGTYLYTPLPERRNAYRSVRAHFAPRYLTRRAERGRISMGLFTLRGAPEGECVRFDPDGFHGRIADGSVELGVRVEEERIVVESWGARLPDPWRPPPRSPAYGRIADDGV